MPVLRDRVLELLGPALQGPDPVYVDGTLGMGGHAEGVLAAFPRTRLVGIDRDQEALALAGERLAAYADRITLVHAVYDEFAQVVDALGIPSVDAALFDLGVSSLQLDEAERGFAYRVDAPLDMRMDQSRGATAAEVLNTYEPADLERILREFGEERYARAIVRAVVAERAREPFTSSGRLVELLRRVVPGASQRSGGHPAKRTFQALRIVGGRIAVLSYHSLEDRITKRAFAEGATSRTPAGMPVERPQDAAYLRLLTRGAEVPGDAETDDNSRAASARLRAAERTRSTAQGGHR